MSDRKIIKALWTQIANNRERSISGQQFLPPNSLPTIFTESAISQAVEELRCEADEKVGLAQDISKTSTVIFAILVWMSKEDWIVAFRNHGVVDANLPLGVDRVHQISPELSDAFAQEFQWQFIPYIFPSDMATRHQVFQAEKILPFVAEQTRIVGGFSQVTQVDIYPSMQNFYPEPGTVRVVRKHLQRRGSEEAYHRLFKLEMKCLRLLNTLRHPNIIPLLGSYTQNDQHYFLFPSLETDLGNFFQRDNLIGDFQRPSTFISAIHGLASALCELHNLHLNAPMHGIEFDAIGYHHDLRPANVLVSRETFVLADFGLGNLKPTNEPSQTNWKAGTGDYLAPECMDEDFHHRDVGRSIDVWAFACLMAEVLTFAQGSKSGLGDFRELRLSESPDQSWRNSCFHGKDGNFRPCIRLWLQSLEADGSCRAFTQLILKALTRDPAQRPRMTQIRECTAFFSLKVQYDTVCDSMTPLLEPTNSENEQPQSVMNIWFERERLHAFGQAFGLDGTINDETSPAIEEHTYDRCFKKLSDLFKIIHSFREARHAEVERRDASENENEMRLEREIESDTTSSYTLPSYNLSRNMSDMIQGLWDILAEPQRRFVEAAWVRRILESQDVQGLRRVHSSLSFSGPKHIYKRGAALAMMKKIRLEMLPNPSTGDCDNKISAKDIELTDTFSGHQLALFRETTQVLVEWMYYTPKWESISPGQRAVVMSLKAKSFGSTLKLESLRLLDCMGFYEQTEGNPGYGFVYRIPSQIPHISVIRRPTTLHELLIASYKHAKVDRYFNEPLLEDKFLLAYTLASFLTDFHSIGWLHENFNTNNIVFFLSPEKEKCISPDSSSIIREPYVLGLHKSRPSGASWQTEGPAMDGNFLDYLHPQYLQSKRFSVMSDYYSFGLMLLEIGLWYPEQGWSQQKENKTLPPEELRKLFLKRYVPRLGTRMGSVYRIVVELCLNDGLDDKSPNLTDEEKEQRACNAFIEKVVYPLAELVKPSEIGAKRGQSIRASR